MLADSLTEDLENLSGDPVPPELIAEFREEHDLTQYDLADLLCTRQPQISMVEDRDNERYLQGASAKLFRLFALYYRLGED